MTSAGPRSSVLALNSGSSSLKFGLYQVESSIPKVLLSGEAESIGDREGKFWAKDANDKPLVSEAANFGTQQDAVALIGTFLADCKEVQPAAVGHRVVHGGPNLRRHCLVDEAVLRQLEAATVFAPLHNPPALSVIRFAQEHFPQLPLICCGAGAGRCFGSYPRASEITPVEEIHPFCIEDVFVSHLKQTIYFLGRPRMVEESGKALVASSFQPLFHVRHAVGGSEHAPLNLWSIVLLTGALDPRYCEPFEQMVRTGLLPGFLEIYIERDLKLGLSRI